MMRVAIRYRLPLFLAGLCGFLAWHVFDLMREPTSPPLVQVAASPAPRPKAPALAQHAPPTPPATEFESILKRPLFSPSRRPFAVAEPKPVVRRVKQSAPPKPSLPKLAVDLLGTVTSGNEAVALVSSAHGSKPTAVRQGEKYDGWEIVAITRGVVIFERAGKRQSVELQYRAKQTLP